LDDKIGSSSIFITSKEFAICYMYAGGGERTTVSAALAKMKTIDPYMDIKKGYYRLSYEKAWDYFSKTFKNFIEKQKIRDMQDLLSHAIAYVEKYEDR